MSVVVSDLFGVSGRVMLRALVSGERDPLVLADLARTRLRAKIPELREAFTGRFNDHHAFLLGRMLAHIDTVEADIRAVEDRIEDLIAPFADAAARLDTVPGIGPAAAHRLALLSDPEADFIDLGPDHYDQRRGTQRAIRNHIHQLNTLGFTVTLQPVA